MTFIENHIILYKFQDISLSELLNKSFPGLSILKEDEKRLKLKEIWENNPKENHLIINKILNSNFYNDLNNDFNRYKMRSPINSVYKIDCPVIFFQGLKDKVVIPQQSIEIRNALLRNNIPVELHTFEEEGHGFRNGSVKVAVLKKTEEFFRKHLKI